MLSWSSFFCLKLKNIFKKFFVFRKNCTFASTNRKENLKHQ